MMTENDGDDLGDTESAELKARLERHLPLGSEWKQGTGPVVFEKTQPYVGLRSRLAQVVEQLDLMEREWPRKKYVLVVPEYTPDHYSVHVFARAKPSMPKD